MPLCQVRWSAILLKGLATLFTHPYVQLPINFCQTARIRWSTRLIKRRQNPVTGQSYFNHHDDIAIDLAHADCTSTAGMALLLEWSTWSSANGKRLSYRNAPGGLIDLVKLNGDEQLLQMSSK